MSPLSERLYELRKSAGLSQDELADKCGVSRQTVSKWERGECVPDATSLIKLADVYEVTVDEIVRLAAADEKEKRTDAPKKANKISAVSALAFPVSMLIVAAIYLIVGFATQIWHPTWIMFSLPIIISGTIECIVKKSPEAFPLPVILVAIYLLLGLIWGLWHPCWCIFLIVPAFYIITDAIKKYKAKK